MTTQLNKLDQNLLDALHCRLCHPKTPFATGELKKDEDGFTIPVIEWRCKKCECKNSLHKGNK